MKLFTKDIDKKLFEQYSIGSDLSKQKVVAKIFNPYGRGTWYILNSDPQDPDYLWAIVDLFEVEVGSVSRSELENLRVPPFRLNLERDSSFTPINATELLNGLREGITYANGGVVKWQDAQIGDSARVIAENKTGLIMQAYGRKFHLKFVDGTEKTYDAKELEFFTDEEFAKGGIVVTSIKDIPNFKERLEEGKITYRGLGMGKLSKDFYDIAGTAGTRIKVDKKEYYITDEEFDSFSRGEDGKIRIRFDAPARKGYANGGVVKWQDAQIGDSARVIAENKTGLIMQAYGRKFHLKFVDGTEKTYDAKELEFFTEEEFAEGGVTSELSDMYKKMDRNRQLIRAKIAVTIGLDNAIEYLEKDYVVSPFKLIEGAVSKGFITIEEINEGLWDAAVEEANDIDETYRDSGQGIGSSDMNAFISNMLNSAGIKMGVVNNRYQRMAKGGVTFSDKVSSIKSSLLKRKKVSPKVQKDYGKTYSPKEAEESAKRIAGSITAKEKLKARLKRK